MDIPTATRKAAPTAAAVAPELVASAAAVNIAQEGPTGDSREQEMRSWLLALDKGKGSLLRYLDAIEREFECDFSQLAAAQLLVATGPGSVARIEPSFWEALDVKSMGHKLLLAKALLLLDTQCSEDV